MGIYSQYVSDRSEEQERQQSIDDYLEEHDYYVYGTDDDADTVYTQLSRDQYEYYKDTFVPLENQARGQIKSQDEIEKLTKNAGLKAGKSASTVKGIRNRNLGRFGMQLSGDQKKDANKKLSLSTTANKAASMIETRSGLNDINLENRGEYVGLGRGIVNSAQSSLGSAASTQAQIDAANQQIDAQDKAARTSAMVTLAAAAMMMM